MPRLLLACLAALSAQAEVRLIRFADAVPFRMGRVTSNRIVHPGMGAKQITLNLSVSNRGDEFSPHVHSSSDDTILVLEGSAELRQGRSRRRIPAGQAAWVPSGQIHGTVTAADGTVMISFQTPPDPVLYTGARDSLRPGAAAPQGVITPGAVQYVDFSSHQGQFADTTIGAARVKVAHHTIAPGGGIDVRTPPGSEQVLFVWKGSVSVNRDLTAVARDAVFSNGGELLRLANTGSTAATVISAHAPPGPGNPFSGRWTMQSGNKTFWMEIFDTAPPTGALFGTTGGRLAEILEPTIRGGELQFRVERTFEGPQPRKTVAHTRVRSSGDGIEGSTEVAGRSFAWKGWRTVTLPDRDDGQWRDAGEAVRLFTRDLPEGWRIRDGVISNTSPKAPVLVSRDSYQNFRLHVEYLLPAGGNSGIGLRGHYEVQLADDFGQPPDVHGNASLYSQIAPRVNASRRAGEWQSIDITLIGRDLTAVLNGTTVIDHQPVRGLTGMVDSPHEEKPGPIALQGDHGPVEFRNVTVTSLVR